MQKLVVVLTGGIASGKTVVSDGFKQLACTVIDADIVAREVVEKNSRAWHAISKRFGPRILHENGEINRRYLRKLVFNDSQALTDLNAITHPIISESIQTSIKSSNEDIVLVVIPLLDERNTNFFDRVLVVDTDKNSQHKRLQQRDDVDSQLAEKMLSAQITRQQRLILADDVISNRGSLKELKSATQVMWTYYRSLIATHK